MSHYFAGLGGRLGGLPDPRVRGHYSIQEIAMGGTAMFLFKEGSRNAFNNDRKEARFRGNYEKLFGIGLPHMDTVNDAFRPMECGGLENVKAWLVASLIRKKVLDSQRFRGRFLVAIDGTGVASYDRRHCSCCLSKASKSGKVSYFHNVLEAKLVTPSGLSLSMATEWVSNHGKAPYEKQDCEREAFKRLAKKLKTAFPRLPIAIVADGLYPWQGFFEICEQNRWEYIVTLQDKSLKSLQEEIQWEKRIRPQQQAKIYRVQGGCRTWLNYHWLGGLTYCGHTLNWVECREEVKNKEGVLIKKQRFVHISSLDVDAKLCAGVSDSGRLRQKIENEGFNTQKNQGYNLEHKFARLGFNAMQNYYQCLQIAHIINQLAESSGAIAAMLKSDHKLTIRYLWKRMVSFLLEAALDVPGLWDGADRRCQVRLL